MFRPPCAEVADITEFLRWWAHKGSNLGREIGSFAEASIDSSKALSAGSRNSFPSRLGSWGRFSQRRTASNPPVSSAAAATSHPDSRTLLTWQLAAPSRVRSRKTSAPRIPMHRWISAQPQGTISREVRSMNLSGSLATISATRANWHQAHKCASHPFRPRLERYRAIFQAVAARWRFNRSCRLFF